MTTTSESSLDAAREQAALERAAKKKRKRGRESALDMVRSMGLVMLLVVPLWFLAQPGRDAEQEVRLVDQSADLAAWTSTVEGAPVPAQLQAWRPTVSQYVQAPPGLRLGWNTRSGSYAEFAATSGPAQPFVEDLVGASSPDGTVDVDGALWQRYEDEDGSVSLVREIDGVTVVVGTRRTSAPLEELTALAASTTASSAR
ncbi:MAG TPA: DUF4245 domain-containing protein [Mycobacteriales bacterium]|nr:DUF4245 domain-containing protein [Mycobacteriales bacterium]